MKAQELRTALASDPEARRLSTTAIAKKYGVSQSAASRAKRSLNLTKSVVIGVDGRRIKVKKIGRRGGAAPVAFGEREIIRKARAIKRARAEATRAKRVLKIRVMSLLIHLRKQSWRYKQGELSYDDVEKWVHENGMREPAFVDAAKKDPGWNKLAEAWLLEADGSYITDDAEGR